jgi:hypothetical protein
MTNAIPKALAVAAVTLTLAVAPAVAQNAMSGEHMMGAATMATYVCRSASTGEKPNSMMGTSGLVCKPVAIEMKMSDGKMHMMGNPKATAVRTPDSSGLTSAQLNDAYAKWLNDLFSVPAVSGG